VGFLSVILVIIYVLVCLFLIMVVLLQQGKGADLAGAFGGGGSQTSFGPRTGTNIMHRLTTVSFVLFVLLSVTLAVRSGLERGESVVAGVEEQPVAEEQATEPGIEAAGEDVEGSDAEEAAPAEAGSDGAAVPVEDPAGPVEDPAGADQAGDETTDTQGSENR
jgi:preprotein translocase subunit SecG